MNKISPKVLFNSKWTKMEVTKKEKHFIVTKVMFDDEQKVTQCIIEAAMTKREYDINWRDLKDTSKWRMGWK